MAGVEFDAPFSSDLLALHRAMAIFLPIHGNNMQVANANSYVLIRNQIMERSDTQT